MVTTQHGPQCICEICTCGRHQCPLNRSSATGFSPFGEKSSNNGNGNSSHFYRKEFATTANVSERAKPARPNPELTLDRTIPFHSNEKSVDFSEQQKALTEARNQRFVTSAAFRKRGQNSQIQLTDGQNNQQQQMLRSTYREESERALQNGVQQRVRPTRPTATTPIFGGSDSNNIHQTVNQSEYAPKRSERAEAVRPKTSDLWKNANGTSLEKSGVNAEYGKGGGRGERPVAARPRESNILRGEGPFHVETNQRSEYGPKRGERFEAKRPVESEIWKNEGPNEHTTVNRSEYKGGRGDRFEAKRPVENEIWKNEGPNEHTTVNRSEYKGGRGDRFEMRKPPDSDILRVQGPFESLSVAHSEYAQRGPGERFESRKQGENEEIWRNEGRMAAEGSVSKNDYQHEEGKRGDRHPMHRPKDTELFDVRSGKIGEERTVNATEYSHTRGERAERKVPQPSGIFLPPPGSEFAPESTVTREHYGHKELVERAHPVPRRSEFVLAGPEESFNKSTNYNDNFQQIPSDTYASRPAAVRPSTALKLQGDREFKSGYGSEFTNKLAGPCPAGELVETLKGHACKSEDKNGSHTDTNNFHFHSVNKGHHMYRSKENLAES
uniref:Uncharacterized protein n=1 Tax=Meloidogyne enterolobii TaxID=390850 RepID=A0A6V7V776_MELEN|nr:unnamed protein product [Meloidogyne enterolobii]